MKQTITLSDGSEFETVAGSPPSPGQMPDPVVPPAGTEYGPETPGRYGRIWDDMYLYGESRTHSLPSGIQFTNMIQPGLDLFWKDGKLRLKGKPVVDILGTQWETKMRELMGDTVFGRFQTDGYGFMDNGPTHLYGLYLGCDLVHELDTLSQGGLVHSLIEAQDYNKPIDQSLTPRKDPALFHTQVLVSSTASRPYNILCDRGSVGGNGRVEWPAVTINNVPDFTDVPLVGLEQYKIAFFPRPPFEITIYHDSLVVDNVWRDPAPNEGVPVTVDRLLFNGGDIYGQIEGLWYPLDIMLVRGSYDYPASHGDMDDRRVFGRPWNYPPGVPDIGWIYKYYPPDYPW